jgi:DNA-binding transcriptional LysR family regulator
MQMNINQLKYFVEVVKQKNFTKAAEQLFVSESTISKSIHLLEKEYDVRLIDRGSKECRLTSEGTIFYQSAVRMLENYQAETLKLYDALKCKKGSLTVGIPPVTITACFSPIIYQYRYKYPDIRLEISEVGANTVRDLVTNGTLDIGVIIRPFKEDYAAVPILKSEAVLLLPENHHLANFQSVKFSQLSGERFMILSDDYMLHNIIIQSCERSGFSPNIQFESSQWDLLVEMVAMNQGISILPRPIIDKFWYPKIRMVHLEEPEFPWDVVLVYRKDKFVTAPMRYFIDLVKSVSENYCKNS